jgi:hypothetical protein
MLKAALTNDLDMGEIVTFQIYDREFVIKYLNENAKHAVVIDLGDRQTAIWRGASDQNDNFYYQDLPLEEPDCSGGDLTAEEAVTEATK